MISFFGLGLWKRVVEAGVAWHLKNITHDQMKKNYRDGSCFQLDGDSFRAF